MEETMETVAVVIIVIVVVVAVAVAAAALYRRRRSDQLRQKFGPEYERAVEGTSDRREAEKDLREREKHRSGFEVTPVTGDDAVRYRQDWADIRQQFVDMPAAAVEQADRLVIHIMRESGYPVDDFEHRVDDISVDYPDVAQHYREAHMVAVAQADGAADTEQLRQAVTSYGQLVDVLLQEQTGDVTGTHRGSSEDRENA
jgi:hypothetical protein